MSSSIQAAADRAVAPRTTPENNLRPSSSRTPERETALSRELEERLSGEIARIRQRIDPTNRPDVNQQEGLGRRVDMRA